MIFFTHLVIKNEVFKNHPFYLLNLLNLENLRQLIHNTLNKDIPVKDLKEGNIVNDCYFNSDHIIDLIEENDGNLEVYENRGEGAKYYFKSLSAGGITERDMYMIKILSDQGFIGDYISIKMSYPFTPAIFAGLMIAVFYGDIMMLITKNLFLVI